MYSCLFANFLGSLIDGFTATYGEDVGPIMSKTFPTIVKLSSTTVWPIFGIVSLFTIIFILGDIWRTRPNLCKFLISPHVKTSFQGQHII